MRVLAALALVKFKSLFGGPSPADLPEPDSQIRVRFGVLMSIKGELPSEIIVLTGLGGGNCGYPFERGRDYLVYAHNHEDRLYTTICSRTARLELSAGDLKVLTEYTAESAGT